MCTSSIFLLLKSIKKIIDLKSLKYIYIYKPKILAQQQKLPIGNSKAKKKKLRLINQFYQKQTNQPTLNKIILSLPIKDTLYTHIKKNNNKRKHLPAKQQSQKPNLLHIANNKTAPPNSKSWLRPCVQEIKNLWTLISYTSLSLSNINDNPINYLKSVFTG